MTRAAKNARQGMTGEIVGANSTLAMLPLDYVEFFVFLAALCLVGFFSGRGERKSSTDYFLAGRRLPWYAVGGSYVAANVSTEHSSAWWGQAISWGCPRRWRSG